MDPMATENFGRINFRKFKGSFYPCTSWKDVGFPRSGYRRSLPNLPYGCFFKTPRALNKNTAPRVVKEQPTNPWKKHRLKPNGQYDLIQGNLSGKWNFSLRNGGPLRILTPQKQKPSYIEDPKTTPARKQVQTLMEDPRLLAQTRKIKRVSSCKKDRSDCESRVFFCPRCFPSQKKNWVVFFFWDLSNLWLVIGSMVITPQKKQSDVHYVKYICLVCKKSGATFSYHCA